MQLLLQQVMAGLANGAIYAGMALAVVMIFLAIDHLNFAQGEMATFSAYVAWQLLAWGTPYWVAFVAVVILSFIGGPMTECSRRPTSRPYGTGSCNRPWKATT